MLLQQVENRRNYLENAMVASWSDLTALWKAHQHRRHGRGRITEPGCAGTRRLRPDEDELLIRIAPDLISTLYAKRLSDVFVILNTQGLPDDFNWEDASFSGICIRDSDLLLVRAPVTVVRSLILSTSPGWKPQYTFHSGSGQDFFQQPF